MAAEQVSPARAEHRWVESPSELEGVVEALLDSPVYGLDTEFHRERSYYPHLALVQLAWPSGLALVDPLAVDISPLAAALEGPGLAVIHAAEQDVEVLEQACGATPKALFDTQVAAGFIGMSSPSLASLVERLLGRRLAKGDRLTDWTRRPLSASQRRYAASDVAHLLDLHEALVSELSSLGRLAWAEEECALVLGRSRRRTVPDEAWWKLKDARQLRGRSRGVAQEVAAWRERLAAETDRPVRFVLPDLAVTAIAQRPPSRPEELREVRGMDGRHLRGRTMDELMGAIESGRSLPDARLHLPPSRSVDRDLRAATSLASAWVAQRASELRIDASLLGTRSDIEQLLRQDRAGRLAGGWRYQLVGSQVVMLAAGQAALAVEGSGKLVLEARSPTPPRGGAPDG